MVLFCFINGACEGCFSKNWWTFSIRGLCLRFLRRMGIVTRI